MRPSQVVKKSLAASMDGSMTERTSGGEVWQNLLSEENTRRFKEEIYKEILVHSALKEKSTLNSIVKCSGNPTEEEVERV